MLSTPTRLLAHRLAASFERSLCPALSRGLPGASYSSKLSHRAITSPASLIAANAFHSATPKDATKVRAKRPKTRQLLPQRREPYGKLVSYALAEEFSLSALQNVLLKEGLVEQKKPTDAINLLGEAIYLPQWQDGEVYIFEEGCVAFWNVSNEGQKSFIDKVLKARGVQQRPFLEPQREDMAFTVDPDARATDVKQDTIIISLQATKIDASDAMLSESRQISSLPPPGQEPSQVRATIPASSESGLPMSESAILSRLAFSAGMIRSCKLAILEERLDQHLEQVEGIPSMMQQRTAHLPAKHEIIARHGELLNIRQELNLKTDTNLLDIPDLTWDAGELQDMQYRKICEALDCESRLTNMNTKLDYASHLQTTLLELQSTHYSHRLEWIIILLIATEIGLVLLREGLPFTSKAKARHAEALAAEDV